MRRVRFRDPAGSIRSGELTDDNIVFGEDVYEMDEIDVLAPSEPTKIVCVGLNYEDHVEEGSYDEIPDIPMLFLKPPNAVAGHGDTITFPAGKERCDYELELGVVIGEQCKHVSTADAMNVVEGFTCANDLSNRDDQYMELERKWNFFRGKAFDNAAPMGPVVADPEHVPADASLELRVNGETQQRSSRDNMIFSVPEIIEEVTTYMTLEPGDAILTGTPANVGPLEDGDVVEIEVEGIGTLEHSVHLP